MRRTIQSRYPSFRAFARDHDLNYSALLQIMNLKESPRTTKGGFTTTALKVARALGIDPEVLYPAILYGFEQTKFTAEVDFKQLPTARRALGLLSSGQEYVDDEPEVHGSEASKITLALSALTLAEQKVLSFLYGIGCEQISREECAKEMHLSVEEVSRIEMDAFVKLKREDRMLIIQQFR